VTIHTNGGCEPNPGRGGYGVVLVSGQGARRELHGGVAHTTNNRMELLAAIYALEALKFPCEVELFSDSRYLVDAMTEGWAKRWRSRNWMRTIRDRASNSDLWGRLLDVCAGHRVTFRWLRGQDPLQEQERCDQLAQMGMALPDLPDDLGYEGLRNLLANLPLVAKATPGSRPSPGGVGRVPLAAPYPVHAWVQPSPWERFFRDQAAIDAFLAAEGIRERRRWEGGDGSAWVISALTKRRFLVREVGQGAVLCLSAVAAKRVAAAIGQPEAAEAALTPGWLTERAAAFAAEPTPAEEAVAAVLDRMGVDYERQVVAGLRIVDFLVEGRLVVEAVGAIHRIRKGRMEGRCGDALLERKGFGVVRIEEEDALRFPETVRRELAGAVIALGI
jgi:ribonuclease HI